MDRKSGVLMHITSLYGDYGVGSFGKEAKEFVDFLKTAGFTYWQVLPFCMTDEYNSPYKSYSAFGGNPYFIDLPTLFEEELITEKELNDAREISPYLAEYDRLKNSRVELLIKASERAKNKYDIEKFTDENKHLLSFCKFMSLKHENNEKPWYEWKSKKCDERTLFGWKFIQYKFFEQWDKVKKYANEKGIKVIGDMPMYVSLDSADVWENKDEFMLDEKNEPVKVAGVPPDYFSKDGQLWGNPLYNWEKMRENGYRWWKERFFNNFKMFDGVRIDHFRAFESYWAVPASEETARNGEWEKGPGIDFIEEILKITGDNLIITEDLGRITKDVEELVKKSSFPGMRVLQFAFDNDEDNPHLPHNYTKNSVAYTGTHDNNTILGYLLEADESKRRKMLSYCGFTQNKCEDGVDAVLRTMFQSHAGLLILPIQDLLGYGSNTRLNTPGKAEGNWQFRVTKEQINSINTDKFRRLNEIYKRI